MKSSEYWEKRHIALFDELYDETQARIVKYYKTALRETENDIIKLYAFLLEHSEDGQLTANDWFKYNRYFETMNALNDRLVSLGQKEIAIYNKNLIKMYERVQVELGEFAPLPGGKEFIPNALDAQRAVAAIWCEDGQHFSDRIWKHKAQLRDTLEKGLMDCINRGVPRKELTKTLIQRFGVSYEQAKRITVTELSHIQTQAAMDRYLKAGIGQYKFVAVGDEATCSQCGQLNGMIFNFTEAEIGKNMPVIHPNCRCGIMPVFEEAAE